MPLAISINKAKFTKPVTLARYTLLVPVTMWPKDWLCSCWLLAFALSALIADRLIRTVIQTYYSIDRQSIHGDRRSPALKPQALAAERFTLLKLWPLALSGQSAPTCKAGILITHISLRCRSPDRSWTRFRT